MYEDKYAWTDSSAQRNILAQRYFCMKTILQEGSLLHKSKKILVKKGEKISYRLVVRDRGYSNGKIKTTYPVINQITKKKKISYRPNVRGNRDSKNTN